jgi:hypothetical protein
MPRSSAPPISAVLASQSAIRLGFETGDSLERLHFVCPMTGHEIDVGIESDLDTLLRIRGNRLWVSCPVCGERHEWLGAGARPPTAA